MLSADVSFFSKIKPFRNTFRVLNCLDPDQAETFVCKVHQQELLPYQPGVTVTSDFVYNC